MNGMDVCSWLKGKCETEKTKLHGDWTAATHTSESGSFGPGF